ncbi:hypothetical protein N0V86_002336 [Didymella sp. IMI 355093]|nr:hypothetical protein N0V86_002336 [Didymella sp. IMI 355093]
MVSSVISSQLSAIEAVGVFVCIYLAYGVLLALYRIYLHPLSKYPGPRLAAATRWYEFYFDVIKRGRFAWEIKRMHEVYGPVVRVTPDELHVSEPAFYDELYAGVSKRRDKYAQAYNLSLVEGSSWTTTDHALHRNRRAAVAPFFNLTAIRQFDPVIRAKLELLSQKFKRCQHSGEVVSMDDAFTAAMTDIVTQYGFAEVKSVMPDPSVLPSFNDLNKLPYFDAVINEGFRLSHGVIARLPRVAPTEDLSVPNTDITIPAGTPIGMSAWLVHMNPSLFPSPDEFRPERWLEPGAEHLKKYLVNFSKGSRVCLGKDLARAEIVYSLALLVRRWTGDEGMGMQLYETKRKDAEIERDFFNPYSDFSSKGVRVVFK